MARRILTCLTASLLALTVVSPGVFGVPPVRQPDPWAGHYVVEIARQDGMEPARAQVLAIELSDTGDAFATALVATDVEIITTADGVEVEGEDEVVLSGWTGRWAPQGRDALVRIAGEQGQIAVVRMRRDERRRLAFTTARELRPILGVDIVDDDVVWFRNVVQEEPLQAVVPPDETAARPRIARRFVGRTMVTR